jgi:hypothetical protein
MFDGLGENTYVSTPGYPEYAAGDYAAATPGFTGSSMKVHHGVVTIIGGSAVLLIVLGVMFRK